MPDRYYIDTCIWIDYLGNRSDNVRPLGEFAFELMRKIMLGRDVIIYSDLVEKELIANASESDKNILLSQILKLTKEGILIRINIERPDLELAREFSFLRGLPFPDAIHAAAAKRCGAILVTRDRHFENVYDIIEVRMPEELI